MNKSDMNVMTEGPDLEKNRAVCPSYYVGQSVSTAI